MSNEPRLQKYSKAILDIYIEEGGNTFLGDGLKGTEIVHNHPLIKDKASEIMFKVPLKPRMGNYYKGLHGGCVAVLIEELTSIAMLASDRKPQKSNTIQLDVDYVRSIKVDQPAFFYCKVIKLGSRLGFLLSIVYDKNGKICYQGSHTKLKVDDGDNKLQEKIEKEIANL